MHPGVESVRLCSDQPRSRSSKAESCFPSSVPFCCLPLIVSQTGKAGAPRRRSNTWHFLTGRARNVLLHPKVVDSLPARRSRSHRLHQEQVPGPCRAARPPHCPTGARPATGFGSWLERGLCPHLTEVRQIVSPWPLNKQRGNLTRSGQVFPKAHQARSLGWMLGKARASTRVVGSGGHFKTFFYSFERALKTHPR